ncbi:tetratricopeptide repeat-containing sensor histidine kinase [Winogradskyella flava]|uniref:tetratricopeptide repeat-containing sensor histidine kinase n=1 Tax=Winogradskyella flava TaxID=1884876 RepID=UPI00249244F3|nr:ATP-binding protein [Winogradskyella flava]
MSQFSKFCFLFFGLCMYMCIAQDKRYDFTAFGKMPKVVDNELYAKLDKAKILSERSAYLDTISRIFLVTGNADSLMHYGKLLKNEALMATSERQNIEDYQKSAMYYQGVAAQKMGLMDEAISAFIQGLEIENSNSLLQNHLKLQLAQTYIFKNQLDKAEPILKELPQTKMPEDFYLSNTIVKSRFLIVGGNYDQAKKMIDSALLEDFIDDYDKAKLELQLNLIQLNIRQGNYDNVITISERIKYDALDNDFYDIYIESTLNEGFAYARTKNYDVAEMALSSAYVNTLQWNRLELQKKVINALVKLYSAKKDYENAYALMTQYQAVSRTIRENQNQRVIKDLELKYETLQKEKAISQLQEDQLLKQAEIERQKTIKYAFLIGFLVILIPVILLLVLYYQKLQTQSLLNEQQEAIKEQEMKSLLQSQELELAKNAMSVQLKERDRIARELHDSIGGNLAGIKLKMNSTNKDDSGFEQILRELDTTYDQVREISHSLIPKSFDVSAFTDLVKSYIDDLNKDAISNLEFNAYPEQAINSIDIALQVALFNIIKELITNALKHANANDISIQVTEYAEDDSISLIYEDDGLGFDTNSDFKGIGLSNIESRVNQFDGNLSINSTKDNGTVISINIPKV